MARQNKYLTHVLPNMELIKAWARRGAIEEDIARNLNVGVSTFSMYKNKYPELKEALAQTKDPADLKVENALYNNATGFWYFEEQAFKCKRVYYDDEGRKCEEEELKSIEVQRFKPGETSAQCFWLKNRRPDLWKDKHDIEHTGEIINNPFKDMTTEELLEYKRLLEKNEPQSTKTKD